MRFNVIGDGSAGKRHARILGSMGHHVTILGPDKASPILHPESDGIIIASPPETHKLYLSWYWDKCPLLPILCEGPITWVGKESLGTMLGPPRMTAENWIYVPQVQAIKNRIFAVDKSSYVEAKQGTWVNRDKVRLTGWPIHANFWFDYDLARWRPDIDYRTTCYFTSGIDLINLHSVMLPLWFFGPAKAVHVVKQSTGKSLGADALGMVIHHQTGTISTVNSSWHAAQFQFGFKMVMADGSMEEAVWTSPKDDHIANTSYEAMCQAWLDAIEKQDTQVSPSLLDGFRAFKALQGEVI